MLQLPSEPAVIYVDSFALRSEQGGTGMLNGADAHTPLASFYDVSEASHARGYFAFWISN